MLVRRVSKLQNSVAKYPLKLCSKGKKAPPTALRTVLWGAKTGFLPCCGAVDPFGLSRDYLKAHLCKVNNPVNVPCGLKDIPGVHIEWPNHYHQPFEVVDQMKQLSQRKRYILYHKNIKYFLLAVWRLMAERQWHTRHCEKSLPWIHWRSDCADSVNWPCPWPGQLSYEK